MTTYSTMLRGLSAKIRKGLIRSTVLRVISDIEHNINDLQDGRKIKQAELRDADSQKASTLEKQIDILSDGIGHLKESLKVLKGYKRLTTTK